MTDALIAIADAVPQFGEPQTSLVYLCGGKPMTDSLRIARVFGRRHDNVLQSLDSLILTGRFNHLDFKVVERPDQKGEARRVIELSERMALIAAPFVGGRRSVALQTLLVDAFMTLREMLYQEGDDWTDARRMASVSSTIMNNAFKEAREKRGKTSNNSHYMTEAKLVNHVIFGDYVGVERTALSLADLRALELVQLHNATLIAAGKSYGVRKDILLAFVLSAKLTRVKARDSPTTRVTASASTPEGM